MGIPGWLEAGVPGARGFHALEWGNVYAWTASPPV